MGVGLELDLAKVINAIISVGIEEAKRRAKRSDKVIKVLKSLGLSPFPYQAESIVRLHL
jgi:hypothetical protein